MNKRVWCILIAVLACGGPPANEASRGEAMPPARREAAERLDAASLVLRTMRESPDSSVPRSVASAARCVVVVPDLLHAGLIVGARVGRGVASCRDEHGVWQRPLFVRATSASAGVQAGVQSVDVVMLMMTSASMNKLLDGQAQLGATTSIAAGPVGREAQASSDVTLRAEVLTYAHASGLFAGLDFSGTVLETDEESSRAFYGDPRDFRALLRTPPLPPPAAQSFLNEVKQSLGDP